MTVAVLGCEICAERAARRAKVSSVNEWGADQTRILLITDEALHRVKFDPHTEQVLSARTTNLEDIIRVHPLTPHGPLPRGRGAALAMGCRARASHVPCNSVWTAPADRVRVLYARGILAHDVPLPARDRGPAGAAACARAVSELPPKAEKINMHLS